VIVKIFIEATIIDTNLFHIKKGWGQYEFKKWE